jgi:predicted membrane metal-binding protein
VAGARTWILDQLDTERSRWMLWLLALRIDAKKVAAVLALLVALFYTALAGAPVPAQRACAMAGFALIAVLLDAPRCRCA